MNRILRWLLVLGVVSVFGGCTYYFGFSETHQSFVTHQEQERQNNKLPRMVSQANGCEVWAFNPGDRWRYFIRCGGVTSTDNSFTHTEGSGKTKRTVTVDDSVKQEPR